MDNREIVTQKIIECGGEKPTAFGWKYLWTQIDGHVTIECGFCEYPWIIDKEKQAELKAGRLICKNCGVAFTHMIRERTKQDVK